MSGKIWKAVACVLALCLLAYLVIVDYSMYQEQISPENYMKVKEAGAIEIRKGNEETGGDSTGSIDNEKENGTGIDIPAETQETDQESEISSNQALVTGVLLCFDQIHEIIYDTVFPLLEQKNIAGMMVFRAGLLPGDYGRISTDECLEMVDAGWTVAIGSSSELDLSQNTEETRAAFSSYLDSYLEAIDNRIGIRPEIFCFDEGEYHQEYDRILEEHGITGMRVFSEEGVLQTNNGITQKNGVRIGEEMDESAVSEKIRNYSSVMLCTQVSDDPSGSSKISMEHFSAVIDWIIDNDNLEIMDPGTF